MRQIFEMSQIYSNTSSENNAVLPPKIFDKATIYNNKEYLSLKNLSGTTSVTIDQPFC